MPDAGLHGNGEECPACALRRAEDDLTAVLRPKHRCNACGSSGRVARAVSAIVADDVAWARAHYWPAFYRRTGCGPTPSAPPPPIWIEPVQAAFAF